MRITFKKYPIDIILCMSWSFILLLLVLLNIDEILRIVFGLPFIIFIPGYLLIFVMFPTRKTERGIDAIERIVLSLGFSIAVVSLIIFSLNYTSFGIQPEYVFLSVFIFIITVSIIAFYRWHRAEPGERFIMSLNLTFTKSESKLDKLLIIVIAALIITTLMFFVYSITSPKIGEKFTDFYLLGSNGNAANYPRNLIAGENMTVIIGITNHEQQTINYTIEIWLINQTIIYNETIYHNMWFMDKINATLNDKPLNIEEPWKPQWECNYTFNVEKKGENFKLAFLLFTKNTEEYDAYIDYKDISKEKLNSAYRALYLWINVT